MCKSGSNGSLGFPKVLNWHERLGKTTKPPFQFYGGGKTSVFPEVTWLIKATRDCLLWNHWLDLNWHVSATWFGSCKQNPLMRKGNYNLCKVKKEPFYSRYCHTVQLFTFICKNINPCTTERELASISVVSRLLVIILIMIPPNVVYPLCLSCFTH